MSGVLRTIERHVQAPSGRHLFCRSWCPEAPVSPPMLFVHGFGEHGGRYEEMGRWFARQGRNVHVYDQVGHGLSSGKRGHVERFDDYLEDLEFVLGHIAKEGDAQSPVVVGHSLGGLISATLACEREPQISLLVLSGPALALGQDFSSFRIWLARVLRGVWPRMSMEAGLELEALSRDPKVIADYVNDPLVHGRISASMAAGMTERIVKTAASARLLGVPVLILHGEDDALCPVESSRNFYAELPKGVMGLSQLKTYPGLRHEIFNEPEREEVYDDLRLWLKEMEVRK